MSLFKFFSCTYIFLHNFLIYGLNQSFVDLFLTNLPIIFICLALILQITFIFLGDISIFCYLEFEVKNVLE